MATLTESYFHSIFISVLADFKMHKNKIIVPMSCSYMKKHELINCDNHKTLVK